MHSVRTMALVCDGTHWKDDQHQFSLRGFQSPVSSDSAAKDTNVQSITVFCQQSSVFATDWIPSCHQRCPGMTLSSVLPCSSTTRLLCISKFLREQCSTIRSAVCNSKSFCHFLVIRVRQRVCICGFRSSPLPIKDGSSSHIFVCCR
jgi:hypothetical protein